MPVSYSAAHNSLRNSLINASNSDDIADICRVAAYSRSLVLNKYIDLIPNCEAYEFAIVLFPHLTLDWFKQNGRSSTQIQRIRESIVARYEELFKTTSQPSPARPSAPQPQAPPPGRVRRRFAAPIGPPTPSAPKQIPNDIHSYLDTPPLPSLEGKTVLQYWSAEKATQPDLAEMALTYCSAPSTSVDGERMSSQTFREQMSLGAWSDAPFFDLDVAEGIIEQHASSLRGVSGR
ncbi:hypothetical protein R3P38DRAFT_2800106 [Favolaschia claudopus]|uniref:HAT C-terminal dimerisation domain-containing protein n=1 Tax=Favolaschia claudopus TaxID=2862362 RepID=A0AAV9ZZ37_9AGAR